MKDEGENEHSRHPSNTKGIDGKNAVRKGNLQRGYKQGQKEKSPSPA